MGNNFRLLLSGVRWPSKLGWQIKPLPASLWFFFLVLLGSFFGCILAQASNAILSVSGSRVPFAIDDFDEDLGPDGATVQSVSIDSSNTIYKVQLELSTGWPQFIHLVGSAGDLRIVSRDVNDDDNPDLIVRSAWQEEPLAVFLNDGRGAFSLADPSSFPGASSRSGKTLNDNLPLQTETVAIPPRSPVGDFSGSQYPLPRLKIADFAKQKRLCGGKQH